MKKNVRSGVGCKIAFRPIRKTLLLSVVVSVFFASTTLFAETWKDSLKGKLNKVNEKANSVSEKLNEKAQKVSDKLDETFDPQSEDNQTMSSSVKTTSEKVSKASEEITPEQEYYIGRAVAAKILSGTPRASGNATMETYLNQICQAIVLNSDQSEIYNGYHVALLDSNTLNAVSTPGGHILISKGLVRATENEDQLAAVIAHEISHIQLKHATKSIKSSRTADALLSVVGTTGTIATKGTKDVTKSFSTVADSLTDTLVNSGYSKKAEYDADSRAVELMLAAGYNPDAMTEMLEVLDKKLGDKDTGLGKTHPSPKSRKASVKGSVVAAKRKVKTDNSAQRASRFKTAMASMR